MLPSVVANANCFNEREKEFTKEVITPKSEGISILRKC